MEDKIHKPYSKYRSQPKNSDWNKFNFDFEFNFKALLPYIIVFFVFIFILMFVLFLVDKVLMPMVVYGKSEVKVPMIVNTNIKDAEQKLTSRGLNFKIAGQLFSEQYAENTVLSQTPSANSNVKEGRTIYITLSKGNQKVEVPNIVGLTIRNAKIELLKYGLELGNVIYDYSDVYGKDTIMYQEISYRSMVPYGKKIDVIASNGSQNTINVPNLIGLNIEEATELINASGLIIKNISYRHSETFTPNTIIEQEPLPGVTLSPNSPINIVVSK